MMCEAVWDLEGKEYGRWEFLITEIEDWIAKNIEAEHIDIFIKNGIFGSIEDGTIFSRINIHKIYENFPAKTLICHSINFYFENCSFVHTCEWTFSHIDKFPNIDIYFKNCVLGYGDYPITFSSDNQIDYFFNNCYLSRVCVIEGAICLLNDCRIRRLELNEDAFLKVNHYQTKGLKRSKRTCSNICFINDINLLNSNLSGVDLIPKTSEVIKKFFETTKDGIIAYKTFNERYTVPDYWNVECGSIIEESVDPRKDKLCAYGINVATLDWIKRETDNPIIYKILIPWEYACDICVPYDFTGKMRCGHAKIIDVFTREELKKS